jgi:simple sugar transport system permease protein
VLNLGLEGMMLVGAVSGFAATLASGSMTIGFFAGATAGMGMALVFAFLTQTLQTNQVATGLALALFGIGLSAFVGQHLSGQPLPPFKAEGIPLLSQLPVLGELFFRYDALVYLSLALVAGVHLFFEHTHSGLALRGIGEAPAVAHSIGYPVVRIRYLAILFGGAASGIAGAYLSEIQTPMWVENMTAGKGWIALALVVFGTWRPIRVALGAYLFGAVTVLQLFSQGAGVAISSELMSMIPYAATIIVLVIICRDPALVLLNQPGSLGRSYKPEA